MGELRCYDNPCQEVLAIGIVCSSFVKHNFAQLHNFSYWIAMFKLLQQIAHFACLLKIMFVKDNYA